MFHRRYVLHAGALVFGGLAAYWAGRAVPGPDALALLTLPVQVAGLAWLVGIALLERDGPLGRWWFCRRTLLFLRLVAATDRGLQALERRGMTTPRVRYRLFVAAVRCYAFVAGPDRREEVRIREPDDDGRAA